MTKIKSFDRTTVRDLRSAIEKAMMQVQESTGVKFSFGTIRFSSAEFRVRMTATLPDLKTKQSNPHKIKPEVGVSFKLRRTWYTIREVHNPNLKYCLSVTTQRGKRWKVPMWMFEAAERVEPAMGQPIL